MLKIVCLEIQVFSSLLRLLFKKKLADPEWSARVKASRLDFALGPNYTPRPINPIRPRLNFSSAFLNGNLYVYGGFLGRQTSLNDLWRFSADECRWDRCLCYGIKKRIFVKI